MALKRDWRKDVPITLGEMREARLDLDFYCILCHRETVTRPLSQFDHLPGETTLHDLARRARCTTGNHQGGCGVSPSDWTAWSEYLERTGQESRVPYWRAFTRPKREDLS